MLLILPSRLLLALVRELLSAGIFGLELPLARGVGLLVRLVLVAGLHWHLVLLREQLRLLLLGWPWHLGGHCCPVTNWPHGEVPLVAPAARWLGVLDRDRDLVHGCSVQHILHPLVLHPL